MQADKAGGNGYEVAISDCEDNARVGWTEVTHGNGLVTTGEYDADHERLLQIYT